MSPRLLALLVIRNRPEDIGSVPDGELPPEDYQRAAHASATTGGLTLSEAMRTRIFWALTAGLIFFPFGMITWISHAAPFYESVGRSSATAAGLVSLSAALAIPPRLFAGFFADRLPRLELGAAGVGFLLAISMLILVVDSSPIGIALFFPLFVFGFATGGALFEGLLIPRAFGVQHYATILGTIVIMQTVGFVLGPTIAGAIYDETGSYQWALVMMAALFTGTGLSFLLAAKLPRPQIPARD
ncbi:MAG: MFS transporter [Dehalococcoidia bacterium]|nr:MFS transporter [Dehalococcoidia bacterium]